MFAGCSKSKYILEFKDKTDFQGNQVIAEARFLRAYYQFELVKGAYSQMLDCSGRRKIDNVRSSVSRSGLQI
jgi:hypothetical protein